MTKLYTISMWKMTTLGYLWKATLTIQLFPSPTSLDSPPKEHREANKTAILGAKESWFSAHSGTSSSQHAPPWVAACFTELPYKWFFFLFWIKMNSTPARFHYFVYPSKTLVYLKLTKHVWFCLQMVFACHEITKRTFSLIALIYLPISLFVAVIRKQMISTVYFIYGICLKIKLQSLIQMLEIMELWHPRA